MVDLARRNGLIFDAVLGAGYSRDYKPKPALYRDAVAAFGVSPAETMMVAAHSSDLEAAASHGLSTAHIARRTSTARRRRDRADGPGHLRRARSGRSRRPARLLTNEGVSAMADWDPPALYTRFEDERTRSAAELLARIPLASPALAIDLGCGPAIRRN